MHDDTSNRYQMYIGEILELEERTLTGGNWSISSGSSRASIVDNGLKATVTGISPGNVTVRYRVGSSGGNFFYITVLAILKVMIGLHPVEPK